MPLPFILAGAAIAAAGFGAKKGYDGYQDKSLANDILDSAKRNYREAKSDFDIVNDSVTESLTELGELQLQIGSEFKEFRTIAKDLLAKINKSEHKDLSIDIPQHKLDKIDGLALSATTYVGKVATAGVGGAAAAYAVYGGVMTLAAASTGTPIAALSGAAAYNATMAAIGGGSIAAGGFGMAGGAMVLGGVVAAPILAIAGWAFASHAEDALNAARDTREEVANAIDKMSKGKTNLLQVKHYVEQLYTETSRIHEIFLGYFKELKQINTYKNSGGDINALEKELLLVVGNGYEVAAILTDIITTPLFKPKYDNDGEIVIGEDKVVEVETDQEGMKVINSNAIDKILESSRQSAMNLN